MQPFQITAVNNALQSLSNKQSDIVVAPGGAGKSHIIKGILKELPSKDKIVILQPTLEILQQNYDRYIEEVGNDDIGIY
jgi:superfamily II DNA or RNA helicase